MPRGLLEAELIHKERPGIPEKVIVVRKCTCGAYSALALDFDPYTDWRFGRKSSKEAFPNFNETECDILDFAICSVCWDLDRLTDVA